MGAEGDRRFSLALTSFLDQCCTKGANYSITDEQLFHSFKEYWMQAPECFDHPALLGQFRVELEQRGFSAIAEGKHPVWTGLTLRKKQGRQKRKKKVSRKKSNSR